MHTNQKRNTNKLKFNEVKRIYSLRYCLKLSLLRDVFESSSQSSPERIRNPRGRKFKYSPKPRVVLLRAGTPDWLLSPLLTKNKSIIEFKTDWGLQRCATAPQRRPLSPGSEQQSMAFSGFFLCLQYIIWSLDLRWVSLDSFRIALYLFFILYFAMKILKGQLDKKRRLQYELFCL